MLYVILNENINFANELNFIKCMFQEKHKEIYILSEQFILKPSFSEKRSESRFFFFIFYTNFQANYLNF